MKKIKFTCTNCQAKLRVPTHLAGVSAPCPKCGATITAPTDFENVVEEPVAVATGAGRATSDAAFQPTPSATSAGVAAPVSQPRSAPRSETPAAPPASAPVASPDPRISARVESVPASIPEPAPAPAESEPEVEMKTVTPEIPVQTMPLPVPVPPDPEEQASPVEELPPQAIPEPRVTPPERLPILESPPVPVPADAAPEETIVDETIYTDPPAAPEPAVEEVHEAPAPVEQPPVDDLADVLSLPPVPASDAPDVFPDAPEEIGDPSAGAGEMAELSDLRAPGPDPSPDAPIPPVAPESPVAEETEAPVEAPVTEKTQPIRVNPRPSELPPMTGETSFDQGELPRLDVNLAEGGETGDLESFLHPSEGEPGLTRIQLPGPGSEAHQFSPEDFVVPDERSASAQDAVPVNPTDLPAPEDMPLPRSLMEEPQAKPEPEGSEADAGAEVPGAVAGAWTPEQAALDLQESAPPAESVSPETAVPAESPAEPHSPAPVPEVAGTPLAEGTIENLLAQQAHPEAGTAASGGEAQTAPGSASPPGSEWMPENAAPEAPAAEMPSQDPSDSPSPPALEPAKRSDADVLDEMFGSSGKGSGPNRATIVMLSVLGAVAVIAVIVVIIAGNALGGFGLPTANTEQTITPPPSIEPDVPGSGSANGGGTAKSGPVSGVVTNEGDVPADEAPAAIDPAAGEGSESPQVARSTTILPGDTDQSVRIVDSPVQIETPGSTEPAATLAPGDSPRAPDAPASTQEPAALSFDERIQRIVNGGDAGASAADAAGAMPSSPGDGTVPPASSEFTPAFVGPAGGATDPASAPGAAAPGALAPAAPDFADTGNAEGTKAADNYNPPPSFAAPGPDDSPLGKTHDLLDAFLRAPDWESRIRYVYQGESLRPAIEEYHKKWPVVTLDRYMRQLFQMEQDPELGGPYWVYLISTSDLEQGFPLIIREEGGLLKVDWEVYAEFQDEHFVEFQRGAIPSPHTFRLVIERVSDYYGPDREAFANLDDYLVYQVNPPYGDLNEFSDYAFVPKDSELASRLDSVVGINDEPLAVIVTLEEQSFAHGTKHLVVTEYVTEGWFR